MTTLADLMQAYADQYQLNQQEGVSHTPIPGVHFYRSSQGRPRYPLTYQSGIIIMGQGNKIIHLRNQSVTYGPGTYLLLGVPLPLECESYTLNDQPLLGLVIDCDMQVLRKVSDKMAGLGYPPQTKCCTDCGLSAEPLTEHMQAILIRLLQSLLQPLDAAMLGQQLVEELIYRILTGRKSYLLMDLLNQDGHYARIAQALQQMHSSYSTPISVDTLAASVHMSSSTFHRAFRQVTTESPIQYLKKIRLNKARDLILLDGKRAADAAHLVGYSSPSQFNREFKRHFNTTPKQLIA